MRQLQEREWDHVFYIPLENASYSKWKIKHLVCFKKKNQQLSGYGKGHISFAFWC